MKGSSIQFTLIIALILLLPRVYAQQDNLFDSLFTQFELHKSSDIDSATYYAHAAIAEAKKQANWQDAIKANNALADMFYYANEREKSFDYLKESLALCDKYEFEEDKIEVLYSMGLHYSRSARRGYEIEDSSKLHTALDFHHRALELAKKYNDLKAISKGYNLSGMVYDRLEENEKSKEYYQLSEDYSRQDNDSVGLGYTLDYAGSLYAKIGEYAIAEKKLLEALVIRERLQDKFAYAINLNNMGEFYRQINQNDKAIDYFRQSLKITEEINFHDLAMHTMGLLSTTLIEKNRYKEAYELKLQEQAIKDDLYGIERKKVLDELETKYESEIKDRQLAEQELEIISKQAALNRSFYLISLFVILILALVLIIVFLRSRFKKKQIMMEQEKQLAIKETQINAALASQESERKRFAQDLHDGFGQLITSLRMYISNMENDQKREARESLFEKSEKVLDEMHREIRNIAFNLMPTTLIQSGLAEATQELATKLNQNGSIRISVEAVNMDNRLSEVQEISLYRVIQEWINNVLKYAEAKSIDIQLINEGNELLLMIEDNGKGFDPNTLKNSQGNGWKNMQSRLNLIQADIEIDSREGVKGTVLQVIVPLAASKNESVYSQPAELIKP